MAEAQKYNLREELDKADKKYDQSTAVVGMSSLTQPAYINSSRTQMFTSHLKQFVNLIDPDFPYFFTNSENTVGKHSSGYKKTKNDYIVVKKISKYEDILDTPNIYHLFIYDKKHDKYEVITRKTVENLTENFGFRYNNEVIDCYDEGSKIKKGEILYKSDSYDESMNYRYGKNATVMYMLDPFTSEDAAVISESFSNKMTSIKVEDIMFGLNDNDIPLNLFGNSDEYKPMPDIGEKVKGILIASRPQYNNQLLYDFKDSNLYTIKDTDRVTYYNGTGIVLDYEIYCNNEDLEYTSFNAQIIKYMDAQKKYYEQIADVTEQIINSGSKYSRDIDYLYKRACEFLDTKKKWKDKDSAFSNIMIKAIIMQYVPLKKGGKFTGRYGNKSVVSQVRPDDEMPYTKDGKKVDVILNLLAIINRTTGFVPHEMYLTFICDRCREQLSKLKTLKEKEKLLFDVIKEFNEKQYKHMYSYYKSLSTDEKKEYIQSCIDDGIYIHQMPIWETKPIFHRLYDLTKKYDWIKPYDMYVKKWGREYKIFEPIYLGEMYLIKLKQTDDRGFSARATGAINTKGLPERSYKNRTHQDLTSDTAIRFGEFETLNFLIAMSPEELALFHAFYRTSIKARNDLVKSFFKPQETAKIDDSYTSRVAEIFYVIFKSLSLEILFEDDDDIIKPLSTENINAHEYDGEIYISSDYDFYLTKTEKEVRKKILELNPVIEEKDLEEMVKTEMATTKHLLGSVYDENGNVIIK